MQRPIEKLTFKDGKIYELYNGKLSNPVMGLSEVRVVEKLSMQECDKNQCEFGFGLSSAADPFWISLFKEHLSEFPVEFQGDRMILICSPSSLEERYSKIKDSMAQTNARYAKERQELIGKIIAKDEALKAAQQRQEDRKAALKNQFDKLQI